MRKLKIGLVAALASALLVSAAVAAVVTRNGQGFANANATATNPLAVSGTFASPKAHAIISTIAVANGDSATSRYNIGTIPTDAVIDPASLVYGSGIAGLTSVSVGFDAPAQPVNNVAWAAAPTALVNAEDWHTAASFSLTADLAQTNYGKRVWEILGLSVDPGGVVTVYATVNNTTSAAGTLQFFLKYLLKQ